MNAPAPRRTCVKICGLTRAEDVRWARARGADWLGFILHADSPRRIEAAQAAALTALADGAVTVGVMVGVTPREALALAQVARVGRVQLHGVDAATWPADFPLECHFAVGVDASGAFSRALPAAAHLVHLDTATSTGEGGTGRVFPWAVAAPLARERRVVLAGGLGPDNVAAALAAVRPFAVDASSRLEAGPASPGIKDPETVQRFIAAVRQEDDRGE